MTTFRGVVFPLALLLACSIGLAGAQRQFGLLNIAHMVNNKAAVDWAVTQGASGVEFDVQYSSVGAITGIKHSDFGSPCDCSCACGSLASSTHVCSVLTKAAGSGICGCYASVNGALQVAGYLAHLATKPSIKLAYFDTKFAKDDMSQEALTAAGKAVIVAIRTHLLSKPTYSGVAVVNGLKRKYSKYIQAAWTELKRTPTLIPRVYFVYDNDNTDIVALPVDNLLSFGITNVLYATGISTCAPGGAAFSRIKKAQPMLASGKIKGLIVWTLDSTDSMSKHLDAGVTAIVTNKPGPLGVLLNNRALSRKEVPCPSGGCQWGDYTPEVRCKAGSWARGFRTRVEPKQGPFSDDSAMNSVQLECWSKSAPAGVLNSFSGLWGGWSIWQMCPKGSFIQGARLWVEAPQGAGDDSSVNGVDFLCTGGKVLKTLNQAPWGAATTWRMCPAKWAVCAYSIKFEKSQGAGDDSAMNNLAVSCCPL